MDFLLLDDRANLKLAILRLLEQQYSFSERKDRLCERLGISQYLLERSMLEINEDLKRFGLIEAMEVIEQNNEIILFQSVKISSSIVEEYYLKHSLEFTLLKTIFFHQFTSIKKYGEEHGMSRTLVYKIVDRIRKELEQYDIKLSKNFQLVGNELHIRQYFTMLYYRIYKDSDELYSQLDILAVNDLFAKLKTTYEEINSFYLFRHYLLIMLERIKRKQRYFLSANDLEPLASQKNQSCQIIDHWTKQTISGTKKELEIEVTGILSNLSIYRKEFCDLDQPAVKTYLLQLKKVFQGFPMLKGLEPNFCAEVNRILYRHLLITPLIDITLRVMDLDFFHERYPVIFERCRQFICQLPEKEFRFSKKSLFFNLLLVVSQQYDKENEKHPINVHVNFTQGEKYNQFIKEQIKIFDSFNIQFHSTVRPDTDLIVSDYLLNTAFSARKLIWLAPPRASDWRNFGNEIVAINKNLQVMKRRNE
ncbi:helix-turn-helix domain-containing protein [Enterococcus sp. DIV0242_7C1]|uniref:Mga helix-turn-helix domain-containing protein n=1 Tax=Candidatus Enterococcus dunnyi TaxID=1834192 RepID=A0A200J6W7_9ENTE|nr:MULTISPECIES: helix-turn-helix domain-containing protein [unclassified Enterococcus]MBO0469873.1 helix-turn-helix domain-containing protein [Enterococcus sp. DIV0242_7C1]OUZ32914.1 hypothetical protein A5889_001623 [Enterococcus sp. 9D6_DIV0238]